MLPEGWTYANLGEIASTVTSGSRDWAQYYSDAGDKFVRMTNLSRDGVRISENDMKYVAIPPDSSDGKRTSLKNGDILISITAELGKIGLVPKGFGTAFINQHLALVRLKNGTASSPFVAYALSSKKLNQKLNSLNDAGAKAGLNLSTIRSFPLALPPLAEQKKIAAILSTWDRAIEGTEKLLANSQQQKKALMQQLLTGKKRLPGFTGEWFHLPFKKVAELIYGKALPEKLPAPTTVYPVYGTGGIISYSGEYLFEGPSIIIGRKGTIDTPRYVNTPFWCIDTTFYCKSIHNNDVKFLYYSICFVKLRRYVEASGVPSLSRDTIYSIPLPPPPSLPEQQAIAAVLSAADEEIMATEADLSRLRQEKKALMQQLLTGKRRVTVD